MNKTFQYFWFALSVLLLLYAFDALIFGITTPVFNPNLLTFTDRLIRAFISIGLAAAIITYLKFSRD